MSNRRVLWIGAAAAILLVVIVVAIIALGGKPVRIELSGTEGLRVAGTIKSGGSEGSFSGVLPNTIRVANARSVDFTIEKQDGADGTLAVEVFWNEKSALRSTAGKGLTTVRGNISSGSGSIDASSP